LEGGQSDLVDTGVRLAGRLEQGSENSESVDPSWKPINRKVRRHSGQTEAAEVTDLLDLGSNSEQSNKSSIYFPEWFSSDGGDEDEDLSETSREDKIRSQKRPKKLKKSQKGKKPAKPAGYDNFMLSISAMGLSSTTLRRDPIKEPTEVTFRQGTDHMPHGLNITTNVTTGHVNNNNNIDKSKNDHWKASESKKDKGKGKSRRSRKRYPLPSLSSSELGSLDESSDSESSDELDTNSSSSTESEDGYVDGGH
jgi:hypothetical protein